MKRNFLPNEPASLLFSPMRSGVAQKVAQTFGGDGFGAARAGRFLLEIVARRYDQTETLRVFARQSFDDRVGGLPRARIKNLDLARLGFLRHPPAAAIEDDHDVNPGPILKVAQLPDQGIARERSAPFVEEAQFRPGKNDAVTVDQKILRPHGRR